MAAAAGGFDAVLVESLDDDKFRCPVCQFILKEPKQTPCGHHVCGTCLNRSLQHSPSCPTCSADLQPSETFADVSIKREILKLKIQCNRNEEGCEWIGKLEDQVDHDEHCDYVRVNCAKECGETVRRKDMDHHAQNDCASREVCCEHCASNMKAVELQGHIMKCDMYPVNCTYDCVEMVPRHLMAEHVSRAGTCSRSPHDCDFKGNGCHFRGTQSELLQHIESNAADHISLFAIELSTTRQQMKANEEKMASTEENLRHELAITKQTLEEELAAVKQKLEHELVTRQKMEDQLEHSLELLRDELAATQQKLAEAEHRIADMESQLQSIIKETLQQNKEGSQDTSHASTKENGQEKVKSHRTTEARPKESNSKKAITSDTNSDVDSEQQALQSPSWCLADASEYLCGYPGKEDNPHLKANVEFYQNKRKSVPEGDFIDRIHKNWWNQYSLLEKHHGYIQWLFPIRDIGMNEFAQELQPHEARTIREDKTTRERVLKSYRMMLNFYGMKLTNPNTGAIGRAENYKARYANLNGSVHNYMRITRILMSLGELGFEHFKAPFVRFCIQEVFETGALHNLAKSCKDYWIYAIKDERQRKELRELVSALPAD